MALTKTRKIGKLINANRKFLAFDSDQINSTYSKGSTGAGGSGTTLVVATIDDLPLVTTEGNKALVSSTNTLYLYNNGWYKIAIINNFNPQWITEPDSEYTLDLGNIDSDLVITVYATDSDDVPLTYSAVVDSDFNVAATITHDSDKDNRWVISRRDSELGAGITGVVTFKASDGINLVQKLVSFIVPSNYFTIQSAMATGSGIYAITASDGNDSGTTKNVYIDSTKGMLYASFGTDRPANDASNYPAWQANDIRYSQLSTNGMSLAWSGSSYYEDGTAGSLAGYGRTKNPPVGIGSLGYFSGGSGVAYFDINTYNGPLTSGGSNLTTWTIVCEGLSAGVSNGNIITNGTDVGDVGGPGKASQVVTGTFTSGTNDDILIVEERGGITWLYDLWVKP